jgi:hypothetical protein
MKIEGLEWFTTRSLGVFTLVIAPKKLYFLKGVLSF